MNDIKGLTGDIPRKCPKIGVEKLPSTDELVEVRGDPFILSSYVPGSEFTACDYDWPDGSLSSITTGITSGNVRFEGDRSIELATFEYSHALDPLARSRRIVRLSSRYARTVLVQYTRVDGSGMTEHVDLMVPRTIGSSFRWKVLEVESGTRRSEANESDQWIDGTYRVTIAKKAVDCLRWLRCRKDQSLGYEEADEVFVSKETGLTVLIRHYAGKGWPSLDTLSKSPKIEIDGRVMYLWFVRRVSR